jgi:hypothetical protein
MAKKREAQAKALKMETQDAAVKEEHIVREG